MINNYKEIPLGQAKDLRGQKYGTLIPLYRTENKGTRTMWVCQCDCGEIKPIAQQYFTQKENPSCGCINRKKASERMSTFNESNKSIQIGNKYGKLTVIDYLGLRKQKSRDKNESWYLCKCECGNEKEIRGNDLVTGGVISCGCISSLGEMCIKNILEEHQIKYSKEYIFNDLRNPKTNCHLRFDFAVFDNKSNLQYLIEFDGRQHYTGPEATWSHSATLEDLQYRDNLKNNYCKNNSIILKRIPYTSLSHLSYEEIISDKYNI